MNDKGMLIKGILNKEGKKESIEWNDDCSELIVWMEWKQINYVDSILESLIDLDTPSENGRNIYEWNQINQTILDIDFLRTSWNESGRLTFWRFGISRSNQYSIFQNTFQSHWTRFIETTSKRIRIDNGCQIWKI